MRRLFGNTLVIPLLLMIVGFLLYMPTLKYPFVYDDIPGIVRNEAVSRKEPRQWWQANPGRVVTLASFAGNAAVGGIKPAGFRLVNVLLHTLTAVLAYTFIYIVAQRAKVPQARLLAVFAAATFLVHPLQTQAVTYISQRAMSLCTLWYMAALVAFVWGMRKEKRRYIGLSLIFGLLALFSKESAFSLPGAVWLTWWIAARGEGKSRSFWFWCFPFFVLAGAVYALRVGLPSKGIDALVAPPSGLTDLPISLLSYLATQTVVMWNYLKLAVFPVGQSIDHDAMVYQSFLFLPVGLSVVSHIGAVIAAIVAQRRFPMVTWGILFFYVALFPESSLFPINDVMVEHRVYMAILGIAVAFWSFSLTLTGYITSVRVRNVGSTALFVGSIIVLSLLTLSRNRVWATEVSLWKDAAAKAPRKARPNYNLAVLLREQGKLQDAEMILRNVLSWAPQSIQARNELGIVLEREGKPDAAEREYLTILSLNPADIQVRVSLAFLHAKRGDRARAKLGLDQALGINPASPEANNGMGLFLLEQGNAAAALSYFNKATAGDPRSADAWNNTGIALVALGKREDAARAFRKALSLDPTHNEAAKNILAL